MLVDRVGALIGFPDVAMGEVVEDEGLTLDSLTDEPLDQDEPLGADSGAEEIAVESEGAAGGDELDMLDEAFNDLSDTGGSSEEEPVVAPPESSGDEEFSALDSLGSDAEDALDSLGDEEKTHVGFAPPAPPVTAAPAPVAAPATPATHLAAACPWPRLPPRLLALPWPPRRRLR